MVNYQYSGNAHDVIAGIGLINLLWHGLESESSVPIDYRIYDKDTDGKTKNTHFCDMLSLAKSRGINPTAVVNRNQRLENLDIPEAPCFRKVVASELN